MKKFDLGIFCQCSFFNFLSLFIFMAALGFVVTHGLSLALGSRGYSPVAVCRLLIVGASLAVEHGLEAHRLQELWATGSRVLAQ